MYFIKRSLWSLSSVFTMPSTWFCLTEVMTRNTKLKAASCNKKEWMCSRTYLITRYIKHRKIPTQHQLYLWHILASTASDRKIAKIHHDSSWFYQKNLCFIDQNKAEFKSLDNFDVLSSDFEALKTPAASLTSEASAASMASTASTAIYPQKTFWS